MSNVIYLADDEEDIREILSQFLGNAGYEVRSFPTGDDLYEAFNDKECDLVILDVMMPGTDGLTICKNIRAKSLVPIIILTAKETEADQMKGFMNGSDDYLVKPFSPSLLVLRVNALLRRTNMNKEDDNITYGDLVFSEREHTVNCNGKELGLTMTEFSLLECLIADAGSAVSRNDILDKVWGIDTDDVETRVVDETIRRTRQKLKASNSNVKIAAVWGYGYKLETNDENKN